MSNPGWIINIIQLTVSSAAVLLCLSGLPSCFRFIREANHLRPSDVFKFPVDATLVNIRRVQASHALRREFVRLACHVTMVASSLLWFQWGPVPLPFVALRLALSILLTSLSVNDRVARAILAPLWARVFSKSRDVMDGNGVIQ